MHARWLVRSAFVWSVCYACLVSEFDCDEARDSKFISKAIFSPRVTLLHMCIVSHHRLLIHHEPECVAWMLMADPTRALEQMQVKI